MFTNRVSLHGGMNPEFFKGTRIEVEVENVKVAGNLN